MKYTRFATCALLLGLFAPLAAESTVTETVESVLTYPFSDPTPVALLTPQGDRPAYPYFRFDRYTSRGEMRDWKVVTLENPYIKLTMLPELGGKVWGAIEKESGREFIYRNHVLKFRDIAMRGAWTSGGIEFNFGILGHVPTTATPVDYLTREQPDGSVSCYVASYEWITDTWWMVEVNLPEDKAYFTTTVTWHNTSSQYQPCYQWMNAAYTVRGKAEFVYPGNASITHDGEWDTYPVTKAGKNIAWYDDVNFGGDVSVHVLGDYSNFYGIYWHDWDFGSAHYAEHGDKLGAKYFIWSKARSGAIWEHLLTDTDGQYIEQQSGRMFCQPYASCVLTPFKHTSIQPAQTDTWTEYWFPVKDIEGVRQTSAAAALNVIRGDDRLRLLLCPLCNLNTVMYVYEDDSLLLTIPVQTKVLQKWEYALPLTPGLRQEGKLRVVLGEGDLCYSERDTDIRTNRPLEMSADFDWTSAYALGILGENSANQKRFREAEDLLLRALQKDKYYLPAISTLARVYNMQGRYEEAMTFCRRGLSVSAYDAPCNYQYALASGALGYTTYAKDGFSMAARDVSLHSAANQHLAEIAFREGNLHQAKEFAERALQTNTDNLSARTLLVTVYRRQGNNALAYKQLERVLQQAPLYPQANYERYLLGEISQQDFVRSIRCELPDEVLLELANNYERIGAVHEARELLAMAPASPIAAYRLAYISHQEGKDAEAKHYLEKAQSLSPALVFPHRVSDIPALEWAETVLPAWQNRYYHALVLYGTQQPQKALDLLLTCDETTYAPLFLTRAGMQQGDARLHSLLLSEKLDKSWRVGRALVEYYLAIEQNDKALAVAKQYVKRYPKNYYITLLYAKALCCTERYTDCLRVLEQAEILPYEGSTEGHDIYRDACLGYARQLLECGKYQAALDAVQKARLWPENLGVGKPYDDLLDTSREDKLESEIRAYMQ